MNDKFDLRRFVDAQASVYPQVVSELRAGRKRSHWMWFIFPQIAGLGHSAMAKKFAILSGDEAAAYLAHPVLGLRLRECTDLVLAVESRSINEILGSPDDIKFRSSMTLFAAVDSRVGACPCRRTGFHFAGTCAEDEIFHRAIARYFPAGFDRSTLDILGRAK